MHNRQNLYVRVQSDYLSFNQGVFVAETGLITIQFLNNQVDTRNKVRLTTYLKTPKALFRAFKYNTTL